MNTANLPALNASLNAVAAVLLFCGWWAIKKRRNRRAHMRFMLLALLTSVLFLASYLTYHYTHGSTKYQGHGVLRWVYFLILGTHIPLAGVVVPFSLIALWKAYQGQFLRHLRITQWLWPVWMYVSITGVLIYLMLHVF